MSNEELKDLWKKILLKIQPQVNHSHFITWFKNTTVLNLEDDGVLTIGTPTTYATDMIMRKYKVEIFRAAKEVNSKVSKVQTSFEPSLDFGKKSDAVDINHLNSISPGNIEKRARAKDKAMNPTLNPRYTFENFIVGEENRLGFAVAKAITVNPGKTYNPLFIYGGVGLGKTHLLQAAGNEITKKYPKKKVVYKTSENFTNELVEAIQERRVKKFRENYRAIDVLIIDDIQFLANKVRTQVEFFHTFNTLYDSNKQIVLSSDRPPREISDLEDRLRSRFEMGMMADIQAPAFETKVAILRVKAQEQGLLVGQDILEYIAHNCGENIRELEGVLTQIIAEIEHTNKAPSIESVTKILNRATSADLKVNDQNAPRFKAVDHEDIINFTAEYFNISPNELFGTVRKKEVVVPRQICMFLIRKELDYPLERIGEIFGGRNHTTVMHAVNKVAKDINSDKLILKSVNLIKKELRI
ncbi:MAG: chromosomal replication initiator protein DnaA [Candidatus Gracilibacteria bacterium]|nr:chromosomal replication initiator protein DnaA [Candidatus Gracilibacteria bacterium]